MSSAVRRVPIRSTRRIGKLSANLPIVERGFFVVRFLYGAWKHATPVIINIKHNISDA